MQKQHAQLTSHSQTTNFSCLTVRFNGLTLLAYLNYTPRLQARIGHQIYYSRTRCVARAPIGKH